MSEGKLSDRLAIVSVIDPDAYATGTHTGDAIDMSLHRQIMTIVTVGDMASTSTVDCLLTESATSGGTYTQISGKSITQLTEASTDDNKQAVINLKAEELGATMRYVKVSLRVLAAASDAATVTVAGRPRYTTASATTTYGDLSSVDEIVA
jgi:hypothetical protein